MAIKSTNPLDHTDNREIVNTHTMDAPRELVWKAWTDPAILAQWWGPKGFTNTFNQFNLKPGGVWQFVMHGPDGMNYPNKSVFKEIVKPERIVFEHESVPSFQVTASFTEEAGKTTVTFRMLFKTAAECEMIKRFAVEGNKQNLARLEAQLAKMSKIDS